MLLDQWAAAYAARRDACPKYAENLRAAARGLSRTAGGPVRTAELSADLLNRHLRSLAARLLSDQHRANQRRLLLTLWRSAARRGLAVTPPLDDVATVRVRDRLVRAWSLEEVRQLLAAAESAPGACGTIPARLYWPSYVRAAWDTGLRGCDLRSLEFAWLKARVQYVQRKTGRRIWLSLRPATLQAIAACHSAQPSSRLVWPLWCHMRNWRLAAADLVASAGLAGSIGRLRHSSGTAAEGANPGRGHEFLGNGRAVFERHYLAEPPSDRPLPPEL